MFAVKRVLILGEHVAHCKEFSRFKGSCIIIVMLPRSIIVAFQRFCFVIQKGLATQLVIYLPFVQLLFYI
jgi:hypothetical protein